MALTSEIIDYAVSAGDSLLTKGSVIVQNFAASTNQHDQDINWMVCLTVMIVCFLVCVTVCVCFNIVSRIKRDAKEKEYKLEKEKLDNTKEIFKLQKEKEKLQHEKERLQSKVDQNEKKEKWEQDMAFEKLRKEDEKKIIELEKEVAIAKAVESDREKRKNEKVW